MVVVCHVSIRTLEVGRDPYLADAASEDVATRLLRCFGQCQLHGRLAFARDHDLFPALDRSEEFGEVGLGVMDVYFHEAILANSVS